jgi:CheY-like chemotaxis protein
MGSVLVVDDDADSAELMRRLLTRSGHSAWAAEGGAQALEWLAGHSPLPDVIVLDWMMPLVGGADVLRAIRGEPAYGDVRVIIVSAAYENELVRTAKLLGADDYVGKGTMPWEALVKRIEGLMVRSGEIAPRPGAGGGADVPVGDVSQAAGNPLPSS